MDRLLKIAIAYPCNNSFYNACTGLDFTTPHMNKGEISPFLSHNRRTPGVLLPSFPPMNGRVTAGFLVFPSYICA
jgi:hypothetical protein